MSGLMSKRKGRAFEQFVATKLRAAFPGKTVRRSLQSHRAYESDVVVEGVAIWWECEDGRHPNPRRKLAQAERDVARVGTTLWTPVVVWHRMREREVWVTLRLGDLGGLVGLSEGDCDAVVTLTLQDFLDEAVRVMRELKEVT